MDPFVALDTFSVCFQTAEVQFWPGPAEQRGLCAPPHPLTSGRWVIVNPSAAEALWPRGPWSEKGKLKG